MQSKSNREILITIEAIEGKPWPHFNPTTCPRPAGLRNNTFINMGEFITENCEAGGKHVSVFPN